MHKVNAPAPIVGGAGLGLAQDFLIKISPHTRSFVDDAPLLHFCFAGRRRCTQGRRLGQAQNFGGLVGPWILKLELAAKPTGGRIAELIKGLRLLEVRR
jgi:hypothetical protein